MHTNGTQKDLPGLNSAHDYTGRCCAKKKKKKKKLTPSFSFISAALKTHPDRVPDSSPERASRTRKFQLVNDAYYTLSDAARRRDYDAQRKLFSPPTPGADPFAEADGEIPRQPGGGPFSWAWNFFNSRSGGNAGNRDQTENAQFSDVFEEMMREEGMAEDGTNRPTTKFWSMVGGVSGGALGFIVANVPGLVAGAVAGNRLGAVRDAKGKSVYAVFQVWFLFLFSSPGGETRRFESREVWTN